MAAKTKKKAAKSKPAKAKKKPAARAAKKAKPAKRGGMLRGPKGSTGGEDAIPLSTITVNVDTSEYGAVVVTFVDDEFNMGIVTCGNLRGANPMPSGLNNNVKAIAIALPVAGSNGSVQAFQTSKLVGPPYYDTLTVNIPIGGTMTMNGTEKSP